MRVVVTGASKGIGRAIVDLFLARNALVHGIDIIESSITSRFGYTHHIADVSKRSSLPPIDRVDILVNNAGVQNDDDIAVNLMGVVNCTEKYGLQPNIASIVNIASASAHNGAEFPLYAASKGGVVTYTKWTAAQIAKFGATCNSISPGGVITELNQHIIDDADLYTRAISETMLRRWATPQEIAQWVYFVAVVNESMTAQDILIDNGEIAKFNFIW